MSATQAHPYREYAIDYPHHANCKAKNHGELLAYHSQRQTQIHHNKPPEVPFPAAAPPQHPAFAEHSPHHATTGVVPGEAASQALAHGPQQTVLLAQHHHQMLPRHLASQYPSTNLNTSSAQHQRGTKRSHAETEPDGDTGGREVHFPGFPVEEPTETTQTPDMLFTTQPEQASSHDFDPQTSMEMPQHHHHHRLPPQALGSSQHHGLDPGSPNFASGPPSVVGQPGMPDPLPKPRGPKMKFTPEEDVLLIELKEHKNLTWKQIADFFPGRSSGTLQVRYCTKLKAKDVVWTDEMVHRLQRAVQEYENDRWRIIAGKVGNGFTPAACREKATQL